MGATLSASIAAPTMAQATMRAGILVSPRTFAAEAFDVPEPGPGQVRVRLEGSGVCASSLPVWQGREWFTYPTEPGSPGHEG